MSDDGTLWFVIHCHSDDSHVLLASKYVLYDEGTVKAGDEVNFEYPGIKHLLIGKIKGFSSKFQLAFGLSSKFVHVASWLFVLVFRTSSWSPNLFCHQWQ